MDNYKEMLSIFLPEGVLDYFDCKSVRVVDSVITIDYKDKLKENWKNYIKNTFSKIQENEESNEFLEAETVLEELNNI